eukprot:scaffold601153_cov20-Prasinocladus_malaysianus.AAC.1
MSLLPSAAEAVDLLAESHCSCCLSTCNESVYRLNSRDKKVASGGLYPCGVSLQMYIGEYCKMVPRKASNKA